MSGPWSKIIDDDKEAYSEVYRSSYRRFYNYGLKFTDDIPLVEDAIQEVLLEVWTRRQKLNSLASPEAYYLTIFRNVLFKKLKSTRQNIEMKEGNDEPEFSAESIIINKELTTELQQQLQNALKSLTPRQREAIYLRFYEGLSYEEVSAALNITVKATYKIMARGLLQLKGSLSIPMIAVLLLLRNML